MLSVKYFSGFFFVKYYIIFLFSRFLTIHPVVCVRKYLDQGEELLEAAEKLIESGATSKIIYDYLVRRPKWNEKEWHFNNNVKKSCIFDFSITFFSLLLLLVINRRKSIWITCSIQLGSRWSARFCQYLSLLGKSPLALAGSRRFLHSLKGLT